MTAMMMTVSTAPAYAGVRLDVAAGGQIAVPIGRLDVAAGGPALSARQLLGLLATGVVLRQVVRRELVMRLGRVAEVGLVVGSHGAQGLIGFGVVRWRLALVVVGHARGIPSAGGV